jgi:BirA family biotin operon repressor/biotin-[acetyl-CoA-carboxylase] ligase
MHLPASKALAPALLVREACDSTNAELARLAAESELGDFTVLVTDDQRAGRGRLDRTWVAPAGTALAISVLLVPRRARGPLDPDRFGWLPIAAGVAMTRALAAVLPAASLGFKWPNDVLAADRKVCGVLAELLPARDALIVGAGVNLAMSAEQLPVPTATSVAVEGGDPDPDTVLAGYLGHLRELVDAYVAAEGDAERSGLAVQARELCTTLGSEVRVELPGGEVIEGSAVALDGDGRLVVRTPEGVERVVAAGDVTHARLAG